MSYDELMAEYQKTQIEYQKLKKENNNLKIKVENQELQINTLKRYVFGSKREYTPKEENLVEGVQISLFGESDDKELNQQIENEIEKITVHKKKNSKKVQAGIKKSFLKYVEIIR